MSAFAEADFASLSPQEFAKTVKGASDADITAALTGPDRKKILDAIFAKFPDFFRADRAGATKAVIHWTITGGPDGGSDTYEVAIADGACTSSSTPQHEPELAITIAPVDFVKLVSGNGNPVMMFMTGKIKAKGNLGLAANIQNLFDIPKA
jgi:putative sterol carrier protein